MRLLWVILLLLPLTVQADPTLTYLGTYVWPSKDIGGLSGLELSDDGRDFIAISDRGYRIDGHFKRTNDALSGVEATRPVPIKTTTGQITNAGSGDSEGLACAVVHINAPCDISFEGLHRVAHFTSPDSNARNRPRPQSFVSLQLNSGLEALALDHKARLLAIPERSGELDRPFPVYRLENNKWSVPFTLPRRPPFLVVGADIGRDGRLYLLERDFKGILGFASRIRRFTIKNDRIIAEETLLSTPLGRHDNLEGISVWTDSTGALRITLISDDNFNIFQRTELVEYRLDPDS